MPTVSRVTLSESKVCAKCSGAMPIGTVAVKDRTQKKTKGITLYYHAEACPKKKGV
jgi:hypothetical protein